MQIWVDADACPASIKKIIFKAAVRCQIETIFVANSFLIIPTNEFIKRVQVAQGADVADQFIIAKVAIHDLVITADIPLADAVVSRGCVAINPRGELYSEENIKHCLSIRDFHQALRSTGVVTKGPPKLHDRDIQAFANCLDRQLRKMMK